MSHHDITRTVVLADQTEALHIRRFLLSIDEPGTVTRHRIFGRRVVTMGTDPDNDVVFDDPAVSRRHCEIRVDPQGYRVVDLDSKNGTRLGDLRVRDAFLRSGGVIGLGASAVRFETTDDEVELLLSGRSRFGAMVGASTRMREVFATLERVSPTDARVLLVGPPGSGKQLAADAIHRHSSRRAHDLVVFDCAAVGASALDVELFGDAHGPGALEAAGRGTLYLAEPAELSADQQARLTRVLETGEVRRGSQSVPCASRVVTGSEVPLDAAVERGGFRADLYYLLAVVELRLPPLRERVEDIPLLVEHYLDLARKETRNAGLNVSYATMEKLRRHPWPGNVAELRNFIERAVALASPDSAAAEMRFIQAPPPREPVGDPARAVDALMTATGVDASLPFKDAKARLVEAFELEYWRRLLERTGGNVSAAARIAGLHRKSLEYILRKHDIERRDGPA